VQKREFKKREGGSFSSIKDSFFFPADSGFTLSSLFFFFEFARGVTVHVVIFFFSFRTLFFYVLCTLTCVLNWCAEPCLFEMNCFKLLANFRIGEYFL